MSGEYKPKISVFPCESDDDPWLSIGVVPYTDTWQMLACRERMVDKLLDPLLEHQPTICHVDSFYNEPTNEIAVRVFHRNPGIVTLVNQAISAALGSDEYEARYFINIDTRQPVNAPGIKSFNQ